MNKKAKKAIERQRAFIEHEISVLNTITVNDISPELLKVAAPDIYFMMEAYFVRRLRHLVIVD